MLERSLRGIAGFFIISSLLLAHFINPLWYGFTAFIGLNLLQSAFSNWCPMMFILKRFGVR